MWESLFGGAENNTFYNALCGAGLGASFYTLLEMRPYLVCRSYDPKYNNAYMVRFVTGLVAGVILAFIAASLITTEGGDASERAIRKLGPGVIAILGGFSAEAVQQVLTRLVDVLMTVVNGSGASRVEAKTRVAAAQKSAEALLLLPDLEQQLAATPEAKKAVDTLRTKLKTMAT